MIYELAELAILDSTCTDEIKGLLEVGHTLRSSQPVVKIKGGEGGKIWTKLDPSCQIQSSLNSLSSPGCQRARVFRI